MPPFQKVNKGPEGEERNPRADRPGTLAEGLAFFGMGMEIPVGRQVGSAPELSSSQQGEIAKNRTLASRLLDLGVFAQEGTIHTYSARPDEPGYEILLEAFKEEMVRAQSASLESGTLFRENLSPTGLELFNAIGEMVGQIETEGFDASKLCALRPEVNDNLKHLFRKYPEEGEPSGVGFHVLFSVGEGNRVWSVRVKTLTPADGPEFVTVERDIRFNLFTGRIEAFLDRGSEHRP